MGDGSTVMNERTVQVTQPKAKLYVEADLAIREGLQRYPKALSAYEMLTADSEARGHWDMANYITVRKLGYNDHGRVHALLTGAASVTILQLLIEHGIKPDVMESGVGDLDDTFLTVLLSTMLHDIGNQVHRVRHEAFSVMLAIPILDRILEKIYRDPEQRIELRAFMLHSINSHDLEPEPLTIEAGITAVADGTDITKGRGRKAFALGSVDIHSISALAVDEVQILKGEQVPVEIRVVMNNSAGIFQVEEVLTKKVLRSPIRDYVTVIASTHDTEHDQRIIRRVRLHETEPRFTLD
ncbi:MAG: phosphohydrolase [Meiothermus ruber]|jgi:metal-dependent HD superfamily phosphatase/phosphodiesterase|uniref:Phosphohydrolase n=2 Tax=Meiothermus ruber TaxID=277 RepID=A0A7C3DI36_MEIRU|nr:phosphohydrolase [Meiothermus ruber]